MVMRKTDVEIAAEAARLARLREAEERIAKLKWEYTDSMEQATFLVDSDTWAEFRRVCTERGVRPEAILRNAVVTYTKSAIMTNLATAENRVRLACRNTAKEASHDHKGG